jgi:hypothetical protein
MRESALCGITVGITARVRGAFRGYPSACPGRRVECLVAFAPAFEFADPHERCSRTGVDDAEVSDVPTPVTHADAARYARKTPKTPEGRVFGSSEG